MNKVKSSLEVANIDYCYIVTGQYNKVCYDMRVCHEYFNKHSQKL